MSDTIGVGSRVVMHYSITLPDGTVADSSFEDEPLDFTMGDGSLLPGLELALYGLKAGETQTLTLTPEQAFGYPDPSNVHEMPLTEFPPELEPEPGRIIEFTTPGGDSLAGTVTEVSGESAKVDFNHPLAGLELRFTVEILSVDNRSAPAPISPEN
jgi:FKBP-type peptidyl-prolyl cis-trans isomerase SlpA